MKLNYWQLLLLSLVLIVAVLVVTIAVSKGLSNVFSFGKQADVRISENQAREAQAEKEKAQWWAQTLQAWEGGVREFWSGIGEFVLYVAIATLILGVVYMLWLFVKDTLDERKAQRIKRIEELTEDDL